MGRAGTALQMTGGRLLFGTYQITLPLPGLPGHFIIPTLSWKDADINSHLMSWFPLNWVRVQMLAPTGNAKQGLARENKPWAAVFASYLHLSSQWPARQHLAAGGGGREEEGRALHRQAIHSCGSCHRCTSRATFILFCLLTNYTSPKSHLQPSPTQMAINHSSETKWVLRDIWFHKKVTVWKLLQFKNALNNNLLWQTEKEPLPWSVVCCQIILERLGRPTTTESLRFSSKSWWKFSGISPPFNFWRKRDQLDEKRKTAWAH